MILVLLACFIATILILTCHTKAVLAKDNTSACPSISFAITHTTNTMIASQLTSILILGLILTSYLRLEVGVLAIILAGLAVIITVSPLSSNNTEVKQLTPRLHAKLHSIAAVLFGLAALLLLFQLANHAIHYTVVFAFACLLAVFGYLSLQPSSCSTDSPKQYIGLLEYVMLLLFAWVALDR